MKGMKDDVRMCRPHNPILFQLIGQGELIRLTFPAGEKNFILYSQVEELKTGESRKNGKKETLDDGDNQCFSEWNLLE
jgi:hypothetical protein